EDAVLVGEVSTDGKLAAAGHCSEGSYFKAVLIKLQRAVQLAQAVGKIFKRERTSLEIDISPQGGILKWTVRFHRESRDTARSEVGIERFGQLEIDGTVSREVE